MYVWTNTPSHVRNMAGSVKVKGAHQLMACWWGILGKIVPTVFCATSPVQVELTLCYSVFDPMILQVKSLGLFHTNMCCENIMSRGVVSSIGEPEMSCGGPNSISVFCIGTTSWATMKMPPILASEAEAGTP